MVKPISYISHSENEKKIVKAETVKIRKALMGNDKNKKKSLLFALDWFMDPYFEQDISDIHNKLVELLRTVVVSSVDDDVSEGALQLLCDYEWPSFEILEKSINRVSQRLKPGVLHAINMDKKI